MNNPSHLPRAWPPMADCMTATLAAPAGLAVAGISDRRLRLFARPGMGGRSRRHHRRRRPARMARRRAGARLRPQRRDPAAPRAPRRHRSADAPRDRGPRRRRRAVARTPDGNAGPGHRLYRRRRRMASATTAATRRLTPSRSARSPARTASPKTQPPPPICKHSRPT